MNADQLNQLNPLAPLTFRQVWSRSWQLALDNCFALISALILGVVKVVTLAGLGLPFLIRHEWGFAVFMGIMVLLGLGTALDVAALVLNLVRGKSEHVHGFMFLPLKAVLPWVLIEPVLIFVELCGSLLLVFPGILAASYFGFFGFALVDGKSPLQALKLSFKVARKSHRPVLAMTGIFLLPTLFVGHSGFGALFLCLEIVLFVALAVIYDHYVSGQSESKEVADV